MSKILLTLGVAALGMVSSLGASAANLSNPVINPEPNPTGDVTYLVGEISEITFTWAGTDLEIINPGNITITDWNTTWDNSFDESKISASGDKVIISNPFPFADTFEVKIPAGCIQDKTSGNTNPLIYEMYIISNEVVTEEWLTSSPVNQVDIAEFGPTVTFTLNREGCKFSGTPEASQIKYTSTPFESIPLDQWDESVTSTLVDIQSVARASNNTQLVVNLGATKTDAGWYGLRIMDYALEVDNGNSDLSNAAELWYWYKVSGYSVSPKNGASFSTFPGLTIAGTNVVVSNAGSIVVYEGYYDTNDAPKTGTPTIGKGNQVSDTQLDGVDGKLISFNYTEELYNGNYTIFIPANAVTVNGKSVGPLYWHFTINGVLKPLPSVVSNPAAGTVSSLNNIQVKWGDGEQGSSPSYSFYGCALTATGQGGVTLTLPSGQQATGLTYSSVDVKEQNSELETPPLLGSYLNVQTEGYNIPGKYTLSIAPNTFNVTVDKNNIVPNEQVTLEFIIEGDEMTNLATVINPVINALVGYPAVGITWNEPVYIADANTLSLPVYYNGTSVGSLTSQYVNLVPEQAGNPGIDLLAETNDGGDIMYLLVGSAGLIENAGEYSVEIPANIVYNDNGAFNQAQTITFSVINELVKGIVSPASGEEYEEGENVTVTITFDAVPEANAEVEQPLLVTDMIDGGYENRFDWDSDVLTIEGNAVVINLGNALTAGTYYLSFADEAVTVNGLGNEGISDYQFIVKGDAPVVNYLEESPTVVPDNKADALEPFETIAISWEGYNLMLNDENEISATFDGAPVTGFIEDNALMFEVDALENGSYTLVVPQAYLIAVNAASEEYYNASLNLVFVVDESNAIIGIAADANGLFNVVNINGVKVASGKADIVKNLAKGLYIINGKKVMVK